MKNVYFSINKINIIIFYLLKKNDCCFYMIYRQLSQEKDKMAREIDLEKEKKKRLSCHNEELQWKLKKSTEVANHLAVTTKRLSKIIMHVVNILCHYCFKFIGQTPQDLAAMREAQNNYQKLCRESSNSENRYYTFSFLIL